MASDLGAELAKIHIKNLRLRTFIGFNEEEKTKKQDVIVNIVLRYDARKAMVSDSVDDACNYKVLTKEIIALVEERSFDLLEKMAGDIIVLIAKSEKVLSASVEIDKPHALRFADSVSVAVEYRR
ncbi:dihydroneopterin triphosphate 2'-epimerase [sulfur-oxidizing endosymbiont of Gigantopelta aegis]|uniref:dihydroneopterin triphosphate 2'-epimerase n=1 Tax=sulfur-oxidizing endosymbiont of Gigantopelta aegis TaxID=2794934 RepID=UPI0018DE082B|nr:dihydroneopterin triphosphate 2'-epimerase [sulfur-oxidizing endosymbiont of Gigantopelta aegis]